MRKRLLVEQQELDKRISRLHAFMGEDDFARLPFEQQDLAYAQFQAMKEYASILGKHLALMETDAGEQIDDGVWIIGGDKSEEPVPFE